MPNYNHTDKHITRYFKHTLTTVYNITNTYIYEFLFISIQTLYTTVYMYKILVQNISYTCRHVQICKEWICKCTENVNNYVWKLFRFT